MYPVQVVAKIFKHAYIQSKIRTIYKLKTTDCSILKLILIFFAVVHSLLSYKCFLKIQT